MSTRTVLRSLACLTLLYACGGEGSSGEGVDAGLPDVDAAAACPAGEPGVLSVTIALPAGVDGDVVLTDEDAERSLVASEEIDLASGEHTLTARRVTTSGELVGRAYYPAQVETTVCVKPGERSEVTIQYELEPGSEKLWVLEGADAFHTGSYAAADLNASGEPSEVSTLASSTTNPRAIAFDKDGNLWLSDLSGAVLSYARDSLGASRSNAPDITLSGSTICGEVLPCGPRDLAFDESNNLWLAMPDRVIRIDHADLLADGEPTPAVSLTGDSFDSPEALAFDKSGNLWIANGGDSSVVQFVAARLNADDAGPADTTLLGQTPGPVFLALGSPTTLAFDAEDNLWVGYFGPNVLARYTPGDQAAEGEVTPEVQLTLGVLALVESLAFDDAGNLWVTGSSRKVARVAASSLVAGADPALGAISLTIAGDSQSLAFNPPGAGTPIAR